MFRKGRPGQSFIALTENFKKIAFFFLCHHWAPWSHQEPSSRSGSFLFQQDMRPLGSLILAVHPSWRLPNPIGSVIITLVQLMWCGIKFLVCLTVYQLNYLLPYGLNVLFWSCRLLPAAAQETSNVGLYVWELFENLFMSIYGQSVWGFQYMPEAREIWACFAFMFLIVRLTSSL